MPDAVFPNATLLALPPEVAQLVGDIELFGRWDSMKTETVENLTKIAGAQDRRLKLQRVLEIWSDYYKNERALRESVAMWVFYALFVEMMAAIALIFCIGAGLLRIDKWVSDVFFTGVFAQVSAMAYWIVKSLFPAPKADPLEQINEIVSELWNVIDT